MSDLVVLENKMEFETDYGRRFIEFEKIVKFRKMPHPEYYFTHYMDVKQDGKRKSKTYRISQSSYKKYQKVKKELG